MNIKEAVSPKINKDYDYGHNPDYFVVCKCFEFEPVLNFVIFVKSLGSTLYRER